MPVSVPPPRALGRDSAKRRAARDGLVRVLFDDGGARRLPREADLMGAIARCDPRDVWWTCETNSARPVYLLPTREWVTALARIVDRLGVRTVLEVAAGDGFLASSLQARRPALKVRATDDGSWRSAAARMNARDRRALKGIALPGIALGVHVEKLGAVAAVKKYRPDLVIVSWAPPGTLVERVLRGPTRFVLDVGADGDVTGNGTRSWRFHKELLDGPIEARALCRLDADPAAPRHTRVTLFYGARHPDHGVDRQSPW